MRLISSNYNDLVSLPVDDLRSCQKKLVQYYDSNFTGVELYSAKKDSDLKPIHEIYVPMLWEVIGEPESAREYQELGSPLELLQKVNLRSHN